jgi:hypothetical protein
MLLEADSPSFRQEKIIARRVQGESRSALDEGVNRHPEHRGGTRH